MNKKIVLSSIATVALLSLVGCGGNGSSDIVVATGTAFYLDSAVSGINYKCGTQEGITDAEGAFTFDVGSSCTFYLGDIELRSIAANALKDGENVVEDDVKIAQLLQTLDVDGDPANGITVSSEVVAAMSTALNANGGNGTLPDTEEELNALSAELETEVPDYQGHAVTQTEAEEHLATTQATVDAEKLKASLAGKTFYNINDQGTIETVVFNSEGTTLQFGTEAAVNINFGAHSIIDKDGEHLIDEITDTYVKGHDSYGEFIFYTTEAGAQEALSSQGNAQSLESMIVGETFYVTVEDSYTDASGILVNNNHVETLVFGTDGKVHDTWIENAQQQEEIMTYTINNDTLSITTPNGVISLSNVEKLSDYIRFADANGQETSRLFFTYASAEAVLGTPSNTTNTSYGAEELKALLSGKTFYNKNDLDIVETVVFNSDGTTLQFGTEAAVNITFGEGKIIDKDGDHFIDEITDTYIKGHDSYGEFIFYTTEVAANR